MAMTHAERNAAYRARLKEREADQEKKLAELATAPEPPPRRDPGPAKLRKNQYVGRDEKGHRIEHQPPARLTLPHKETVLAAFAERLKEARLAAGLTQPDVAHALYGPGITYVRRYRNWEEGKAPMAIEVIAGFARLCRTTTDFLYSMRY